MKKQYHIGGFKTCQRSKEERFTKIIDEWKALISFEKLPVLDVWQGSEYASVISNIIVINWLIIYLSLFCLLPKCSSHKGKLVLRAIQFGIYYSSTSNHIHKIQVLAETACRNISIAEMEENPKI